MKERPILFSAPMVRAILEGRKTQTRRVVKPQPKPATFDCANLDTAYPDKPWCWLAQWLDAEGNPLREEEAAKLHGAWPDCSEQFKCPYGKPEDRLWVRETHVRRAATVAIYRADLDPMEAAGIGGFYGGWLPSIFMRREDSRILLEITDVRVQRLQEISADDCISEGIAATEFWTPKEMEGIPFEEKWWDDFHFWANYPQIAFPRLWNSVNGDGAWDDNPWVWAITFKRVEAAERAA